LFEDAIEDSVHVLTDFRIREANGRIPPMRIRIVSKSILTRVMRVSSDFDYEAFLRAEEVGNGVADDVLATELEPAELRPPDASPQFSFKRGWLIAEASRSID
jgi:hypothetical protein